MKRFIWIALLVCGAAAFAACSDADNSSGNEELPPLHAMKGMVMGQWDLGEGYFLQVSHLDPVEEGEKAAIDVDLTKDHKPLKEAVVQVYAADEKGAPLTPKTKADWQEADGVYTAKVALPHELPHGATITVEAEVDGKSFKKGAPAAGHEHH